MCQTHFKLGNMETPLPAISKNICVVQYAGV